MPQEVTRNHVSFCISSLFFEKKKNFFLLFVYLFLVALGLHCWVQAFSSCGEWGLLFVAVHGLLIVMVSLAVEHRL